MLPLSSRWDKPLSSRLVTVFVRAAIRAVPSALLIVVASFFLLKLVPGDLVDVLDAESGGATAETVRMWRQVYGLDLSVLEQLWEYLKNLSNFSLGTSPRFSVPVVDLIAERLPSTFFLMVVSLCLSLMIGITLGSVMSVFYARWPDRVISVIAVVFYSIPGFWIGLMMIVVFSIMLGWLPSSGNRSLAASHTGLDLILDRAKYMLMPAISLALFYIAIFSRLMRSSMIEVWGQDYIRTARAKGLPEHVIVFRHAIRNALSPVAMVAGVHLGGMMGGAVVIETIYGWPGLGRLAYESVMARDFNILLGILLLSSLLVIVMNVLADVVHAWLDPRVEVR